ncbi:MAG: alpha-mannosidase [Chloroflexota bacterium]
MAEKMTAVVVSHTHWDREWYLPFQRFRIKLVDLIDSLLDILDSEPSYQYFTLDGQTVVLEDYLEIRPENRERLARHIRDGRILVGPWYVLPDEFLVSGESLVRNLLLGRLIAEPFGGVMPVGYLPDTFGHPSQMPQILRGFGLDSAVVYRGVQTDVSEFIWQAPDGSSVLAVYLPGGYCNAMQLTAAPHRFLARLPEIVDRVKAMATNGTMLLMNGCDHLPPRREIQATIDEANRRLDNGVWLKQGTLPQYLERVKAAKPRLKTLQGEFRRPSPARVTPGVISSRMYLKLENFKSFTMLEKFAEPASALAWLLGADYPRAFLWQAWKYLLQNHPHDSICGCSIDAVHQDMMARFRWTQEIAGDLVDRGLEALASRVDSSASGEDAAFIVFNPLGQSRSDYFSTCIDFLEPGVEFHVENRHGEVVPYQVVSRGPMTMFYDPYLKRVELDGKQRPAMVAARKSETRAIAEAGVWRQWRGEQVEILVLPGQVPACGYATFSVAPGRATAPSTDLRVAEGHVENDLVRLAINQDGSFDVSDKRTGVVYRRLNALEDRGDCGDEYNYCPPPQDGSPLCPEARPTIRLVERGPIRATFEVKSRIRVPRRLGEDRARRCQDSVACPVTAYVSLLAGSPRVEVRLELTNLAEDNVLRVLFPTPIHTDVSHALGQFEVVTRPVRLPQEEIERQPGPDEEMAVNTYPHHAFVDVNDGVAGLAVLSRGLTEYEVMPGDQGVTIALTLLRSVGWLSRDDLSTRYGHAGPALATPDAQCQGTHVFEYAVLPHAGAWPTANVPLEADRYIAPPRCAAIRGSDGRLPTEVSFIAVEPASLVLSALKKAEADDALILRLYNPTPNRALARVSLQWKDGVLREARLVDLAEREIDGAALPVDDSTVHLEVRGYQICSLKLVVRR